MPVAEGKYQCKHCEDIFVAKTDDYSKCKCGKSKIKLSYFGYSYERGSEVSKIEHNGYYLEDEFVKLSDESQLIYDEIKKIKEAREHTYYLYEMTNNGKNDEKYLSQINIEYSEGLNRYTSEQNEISLTIDLSKEYFKGHDVITNRLQKFLDIMKQIEEGTLKVSDRKNLIELADKEEFYYYSEPTGEKNYKFYI